MSRKERRKESCSSCTGLSAVRLAHIVGRSRLPERAGLPHLN